MDLKEYQGKKLFREFGIVVPKGRVVSDVAEIGEIEGEVAVKAQISAGKRGKGGGIKFTDAAGVSGAVFSLLGAEINGHRVAEVLIEEKLAISKEMYLSVILDRATKGMTLVFCEEGGMSIEEIALKFPEKIVKMAVGESWAGLPAEVAAVAEKLVKLVFEKDALLVEINPLAVVGGKLVAADAKVVIDDNALFRQREFSDDVSVAGIEGKAREYGLAYVELDGDIAIIGNGAGLTMASLDSISFFGGRPANFLDVGGGASVLMMSKALEVVLMKEGVRAIFINIFGGITRCDEIAQGIVSYRESAGVSVPMVSRMIGTNEEEGRRILGEAGVRSLESMEAGAKEVVRIANSTNG